MFGDCIAWILSDFSLAMFFLAVFFILLHLIMRIKTVSFYEIVYRWIAVFPLGFVGIYTFVMHAFYPEVAASAIGWAVSPFQFEVAMADLAFGVLGVLSFNASYGFRLATVIASLCMLWGDAGGHIYQMIVSQNFAPGNAGSWFWMDLVIPFILLICISRLKPVTIRRYVR